MANIKSAKKRILVTASKTANNKVRKSQVKTAIRKFNEAVESGDKDMASEAFRFAQKKINQVASKGTIHKNAAARKISKLAAQLNQVSAN